MRLAPPVSVTLDDSDAERVRRSHEQKIVELQRAASGIPTVIEDVSLADGVETPVAHRLGRKPKWHACSSPIGPSTSGRIEEIRSGSYDRTQVLVLKASGWGATITVSVAVL